MRCECCDNWVSTPAPLGSDVSIKNMWNRIPSSPPPPSITDTLEFLFSVPLLFASPCNVTRLLSHMLQRLGRRTGSPGHPSLSSLSRRKTNADVTPTSSETHPLLTSLSWLPNMCPWLRGWRTWMRGGGLRRQPTEVTGLLNQPWVSGRSVLELLGGWRLGHRPPALWIPP